MTASTTAVLIDDHHGLHLSDQRPWDVLTTRLRATTLDRRLAAGQAPESDRRLAVRAATLVTPAFRRRLAKYWADVAVPRRRSPHQVPLAHGEVLAARVPLDELLATLRSPHPVAARGVAAARLLLVDGTSPVYAGHHPGALHDALVDALVAL